MNGKNAVSKFVQLIYWFDPELLEASLDPLEDWLEDWIEDSLEGWLEDWLEEELDAVDEDKNPLDEELSLENTVLLKTVLVENEDSVEEEDVSLDEDTVEKEVALDEVSPEDEVDSLEDVDSLLLLLTVLGKPVENSVEDSLLLDTTAELDDVIETVVVLPVGPPFPPNWKKFSINMWLTSEVCIHFWMVFENHN